MNQKTSICHYSKNYSSLTRVTRLKVAVNMAYRKTGTQKISNARIWKSNAFISLIPAINPPSLDLVKETPYHAYILA